MTTQIDNDELWKRVKRMQGYYTDDEKSLQDKIEEKDKQIAELERECDELKATNDDLGESVTQLSAERYRLKAENKRMKEEENRYGNLAKDVLELNEEIARDIQNQQLTIATDEIDERRDDTLLSVYRQGYRRNNYYLRHKEKTFEPDKFDPFGVKFYTLRGETETSFSQRTLPIPLKVSTDSTVPVINVYKRKLLLPMFEKLFFFYMENIHSCIARLPCSVCFTEKGTKDVSQIRKELFSQATEQFSESMIKTLEPLFGRNKELAYIAFLVCRAFDIDITSHISSAFTLKQQDEDVPDAYLLETLRSSSKEGEE